jgi:signal recognition particle subunit SRP54
LNQMQNMGGIATLMDKLPGVADIPKAARDNVNDKEFNRMGSIIDSMTRQERRKPEIIKGSRKRRIAAGSGVEIQDVNRLLKQFTQMEKMMKKMAKGGMKKMLRGLPGGGLPPGFR